MAEKGNLGEAFLKIATKAIAGAMPGGPLAKLVIDELVGPFTAEAWSWLQKYAPQERQETLNQLAALSPEAATKIVAHELSKTRLSTETKNLLTAYLACIPFRTREVLRRPDDGGRANTLLSQVPSNARALKSFLPVRVPTYVSSYKVPQHDLRLESLLGQGRFGEVWLASNYRRPSAPAVAVKFCLDSSLRHSLAREVELFDRLSEHGGSEYIVQLRSAALSAEPPFLIFEYVDGGDLSGWVASFEGRGPDERNVVRVLTMVARGLAHAHERGVVHHDLKPSNLLVSTNGVVKVADFGIGSFVDSLTLQGTGDEDLTDFGLAGTPMYLDHRTTGKQRDVFAFGVIAYQLLVRDVRSPMPPNWKSELNARTVSPELTRLVEWCVDVPQARAPNAAAVLHQIETIADGIRRHSNRGAQYGRVVRRLQRAVPLLVAACIASGAVAWAKFSGEPKGEADPKLLAIPGADDSEPPPSDSPTGHGGSGAVANNVVTPRVEGSVQAQPVVPSQPEAIVRSSNEQEPFRPSEPSSASATTAGDASANPAEVPDAAARRMDKWLLGPVIGGDNWAARSRPVEIKKRGAGYTALITNQFGFKCDLTFDEVGDPNRLRSCASVYPDDHGWNPRERSIPLRCSPADGYYVCYGNYHYSKNLAGEASTLRIAIRESVLNGTSE